MNSKNFLAGSILSLLTTNLSSQVWLPNTATTDNAAIYRSGNVGIKTGAVPTLFPLEVSGGGNAAIGIDFGDYIGIRNAAIPTANRRLIQTSWDGSTGGVGDFVAFYTPGASGTQNSLEKMRLTNAGCLGIGGDPQPVGRLQVLHTTDLPSTTPSSQIITSFQSKVMGSNTLKSNLWVVRDKTYKTSNDWYTVKLHDGISIDQSFLTPNVDDKTWWERFPDQNVQSWGNGATTHMMLYQGKLSLNNPSSNPAAQLDVKETDGNISILARAYHCGDYGYAIRANVFRDLTKAFAVNQEKLGNGTSCSNPINSNETFVVYGNGATQINTNATDAFLIKDVTSGSNTYFKVQKNGQTCVGCSNPGTFMLAVEGKIGAREIKVTLQNPWPDYVFEKNYILPSLLQVEDYISKNKHLPNVPSAGELQKDNEGVDLGKMQTIQMQKIEELFLYVIELKKENEILIQKVKELETNK